MKNIICTDRESNPGLPRGRREFYHWTISASMSVIHVYNWFNVVTVYRPSVWKKRNWRWRIKQTEKPPGRKRKLKGWETENLNSRTKKKVRSFSSSLREEKKCGSCLVRKCLSRVINKIGVVNEVWLISLMKPLLMITIPPLPTLRFVFLVQYTNVHVYLTRLNCSPWSAQVLKKLVSAFLVTHGKLFTKIGWVDNGHH